MDVLGLVVSVDRMERGQGTKSALREISEEFDIQVIKKTISDVLSRQKKN